MSEEHEEYLGNLGRPAAQQGGPGAGLGEVLTAVAIVGAEVGELRSSQQLVSDRLAEVETRFGEVDGRLGVVGALADQVAGLSTAVAQLLGQDDNEEEQEDPLRPVDLAHIPLENRAEVLGGLVEWVRDVLLPGWPHVRESVRACWVHHPDLVNAMLMVRTGWRTAYDTAGARVHHAVDFHRTLDDVARWADQRTAECPPYHGNVLPEQTRDDSVQLRQMLRRDALAVISDLYEVLNRPETPDDERAEASARVGALIQQYGLTAVAVRNFMAARAQSANPDVRQEPERSPAQPRRSVGGYDPFQTPTVD